MKKGYLFLVCCFLFGVSSYANDTLTRAQVYTFSVGDTFEYRYTSEDIDLGQPLITSYFRKVLKQKTFSTNLDTLFLGYGSPGDTLINERETITQLDSFPIFQIQNIDTSCAMVYSFDTTVYAGYASNSLNIRCFESGASYRYTKGLGLTLHGSSHVGNIGYGTVGSSVELIYYSNGSTQVGAPYIPPPVFPIRYIPLPETCAVWTRTIYGSISGYPPYGTINEQIRTGNQIHKGGKTYVELICRIQNDITQQFTPDSLIGYFYNDSANLSARFVTDTNGTSYYLCSFTGQPGQQCSHDGHYSIDSVLIDGAYRTHWGCSGFEDCNDAKISGIGNLSGLIHINHLYNAPGHETCGNLTCFCVCGQKLYPDNTTSTCDLLSGIPQSTIQNPQFEIFPNPTTTQLNITIDETLVGAQLNIYNTTGALVQTVVLSSVNHHLSTEGLSTGVYIAEVKTRDGSFKKRWVKM